MTNEMIETIRAAQRGDTEAMESLIIPNKPLLRSLASRFFCPYVSMEELMQAGCVGLMKAIWRYDTGQGTMLMTYAVPWILGEIRSQIREAAERASFLSLDRQMDEGEGISLMDELSSDNLISIERIDLKRALKNLPENERTVICLRYFRDKTQKETAEILGCSQAQVSKTERHAIDRMHAMLV